VQPGGGEGMLEQDGGEVRVRRRSKVHLHPGPQVRHQVGENLFQRTQVQDSLRKGVPSGET
jgi:hypothetical protein